MLFREALLLSALLTSATASAIYPSLFLRQNLGACQNQCSLIVQKEPDIQSGACGLSCICTDTFASAVISCLNCLEASGQNLPGIPANFGSQLGSSCAAAGFPINTGGSSGSSGSTASSGTGSTGGLGGSSSATAGGALPSGSSTGGSSTGGSTGGGSSSGGSTGGGSTSGGNTGGGSTSGGSTSGGSTGSGSTSGSSGSGSTSGSSGSNSGGLSTKKNGDISISANMGVVAFGAVVAFAMAA